jgi:hypothetical protein
MLCTICSDTLPDPFTTCRQWCDSKARERGDLLTLEEADDLMPFRGLCRVLEAIETGAERIGTP